MPINDGDAYEVTLYCKGHICVPEMESFHKKFIRSLLGVRTSTKVDHLYCELGTIPLLYRRYIRVINYWARLRLSTHNKLSEKLFVLIKSIKGFKWCRGIRKILRRYDKLELWDTDITQSLSCFQNSFKNHVWDTELATICNRVTNSGGHSDWYKHIMPACKKYSHPYYMGNINHKHIKVLSRFRLRSNDLGVVTGAWDGTPRDQRYCRLCRFHAVEDEVHLLCECPKYEILRRRYLPAYMYQSRSFASCIKLLTCKDATVLNRLCDFLQKSQVIRTDLLPIRGGRGPPQVD